MKLLCIVLGFKHFTCDNYLKSVNDTWGKLQNENIKVVFSYGGYPDNKFENNTIYVSSNDFGEENTYQKLLDVFDVAYNNLEFDVVLKTSLSTYFRIDNLYKVLSDYEMKDFFGSSFDNSADSGCFSGCTMLLSRDVIKKILDNRGIENPRTGWDDTGMEYLLKQIYPNYTSLYKNFKRLDLTENSLVRLMDSRFKIMHEDKWAFRCKTTHNRDLDGKKWKCYTKYFTNEYHCN